MSAKRIGHIGIFSPNMPAAVVGEYRPVVESSRR